MLAMKKNMLDENDILDNLRQQRVLIVGLGATGLSCVRFLSRHGIEVAVTDSRARPPGLDVLQKELPDIAVFVGGFEAEAFVRADVLLLSPGVALYEPLVAEARVRGAEVIGDVELFARLVSEPVIAITGSNGKSSVTTLVGMMAEAAGRDVAVAGNIGTPVLDLLNDKHNLYVLELSSFQLETTGSLETVAATILNLSEDHMDRYASLADYSAAKARIFHGSNTLIINNDDPRVRATLEMLGTGHGLIHFSLREPANGDFGLCEHKAGDWLCVGTESGSKPLIAVKKLPVRGRHNLANALAALALGQAAGLPMKAMLTALKAFTGLAHRCQWLGEFQGINWYNDSKATNVGAAMAAIEGLEAEKVVLIAGGQGKGQDFSSLTDIVSQRARAVLLMGEDAAKIKAVLSASVKTVQVKNMKEAVNRAAELAQVGDAVLLSPACASFDMFRGFEARGDAFIQQVKLQMEPQIK
ncbi:UDP-N-acetylmuramoylalanine--D-glutamate ligase [hydrothermal vent metagenome]|uniref:UDP-N-acetylmuramoylalanine--D-glutamate ligase n=1 Tax=hydrothermal vent metagenome TaxID=652676 RepID=A0A3B1BHL5_9ZZZZ